MTVNTRSNRLVAKNAAIAFVIICALVGIAPLVAGVLAAFAGPLLVAFITRQLLDARGRHRAATVQHIAVVDSAMAKQTWDSWWDSIGGRLPAGRR